MARGPGEILDCDWNPIQGCEKYSLGCLNCWYMAVIFPIQKRYNRFPASVNPTTHWVFSSRLTTENLRTKNGVIGIVQHGDLFWDGVPDQTINDVLRIIEETATQKRTVPTYLLWTKRAERMQKILEKRYASQIPPYMAVAVSIENQQTADERLPHLVKVRGRKLIVAEPLLDEIDISEYVDYVDWVIVGSETGNGARYCDPLWMVKLRDQTKAASLNAAWAKANTPIPTPKNFVQLTGKPFFIKQIGTIHGNQPGAIRTLNGQTWDEGLF